VRDQFGRDQVTVEIATGIGLFVLVLVVGGLALLLIDKAGGGLDGTAAKLAGFAILATALALSVRHVYRHRKP